MRDLLRYIIVDKTSCSGCGLCVLKCPNKALRLKVDGEGFYYPALRTDLCIHCGACSSVGSGVNCSFINPVKRNEEPGDVFLARYKAFQDLDFDVLNYFCRRLADGFVRFGGVVFGAQYQDDHWLLHMRCDTLKSASLLNCTSSLQSDLQNSYEQIRKYLERRTPVLFFGRPCEVSGLYAYLGELAETADLTTCDTECHGAASPLVWKRYTQYCERLYDARLDDIKLYSNPAARWMHCEMTTAGKRVRRDNYASWLKKRLILRPACYTCKFSAGLCVSDIHLSAVADKDTGDAVAAVVGGKRGARLLEICQNSLRDFEVAPTKDNVCPAKQPPAAAPAEERADFWHDYFEGRFLRILKKYSKTNYADQIAYFFVRLSYRFRKLFSRKTSIS